MLKHGLHMFLDIQELKSTKNMTCPQSLADSEAKTTCPIFGRPYCNSQFGPIFQCGPIFHFCFDHKTVWRLQVYTGKLGLKISNIIYIQKSAVRIVRK